MKSFEKPRSHVRLQQFSLAQYETLEKVPSLWYLLLQPLDSQRHTCLHRLSSFLQIRLSHQLLPQGRCHPACLGHTQEAKLVCLITCSGLHSYVPVSLLQIQPCVRPSGWAGFKLRKRKQQTEYQSSSQSSLGRSAH